MPHAGAQGDRLFKNLRKNLNGSSAKEQQKSSCFFHKFDRNIASFYNLNTL